MRGDSSMVEQDLFQGKDGGYNSAIAKIISWSMRSEK